MNRVLTLTVAAGLLAGVAQVALAEDPPRGYDLPTHAGDPAASGYDIPAPNDGSVVALSPRAREAVLEAAARRGGDETINGAPDRKIHGEVGIAMGSRGYHSVYGTTSIPLGQTGVANFSFENSGWNGFHR